VVPGINRPSGRDVLGPVSNPREAEFLIEYSKISRRVLGMSLGGIPKATSLFVTLFRNEFGFEDAMADQALR